MVVHRTSRTGRPLRPTSASDTATVRSNDVKYLLMIYMNPTTWESLSEEDRNEVIRGHEEFQRIINESGEMVSTHALAEPAQSATVQVRDGVPAVTDGPYVEAKEYLAGYYLVECNSRERAIELAALVPDARFTAMEVRPIIHSAGAQV
jgi:hypothetical protein